MELFTLEFSLTLTRSLLHSCYQGLGQYGQFKGDGAGHHVEAGDGIQPGKDGGINEIQAQVKKIKIRVKRV